MIIQMIYITLIRSHLTRTQRNDPLCYDATLEQLKLECKELSLENMINKKSSMYYYSVHRISATIQNSALDSDNDQFEGGLPRWIRLKTFGKIVADYFEKLKV